MDWKTEAPAAHLMQPTPGLRIRSVREIWMWSVGAGLLVFTIAVLGQWVIYNLLLDHEGVRIVGGTIGAIVTTILVNRVLIQQREAAIADLNRFRVIAEMNHHIRNALQTISYQRYLNGGGAEAEHLKEAVNRIEWVLKEILPDVVGPGQTQ